MGKTLSVFWHWEEHDPAVLVRHGIGADIAGGLLLEMAQNCPGRSLKERVASLWQDLQKVYKDNKTEYNRHTDTSKVEQRRKCAYIEGFGCTSEVADAFVAHTGRKTL